MRKFTLTSLAFVGFIVSSLDANAQVVQTYIGYVTGAAYELASRRLLLLGGIGIVVAIIFLRSRNTRSNNMRKARDNHRTAVDFYEKGKQEQAEKHFKKANQYRQKAEEQE